VTTSPPAGAFEAAAVPPWLRNALGYGKAETSPAWVAADAVHHAMKRQEKISECVFRNSLAMVAHFDDRPVKMS